MHHKNRFSKATALVTSMLLIAWMTAVGGCNTTEGVGEDVEAAGDSIQDAAD